MTFLGATRRSMSADTAVVAEGDEAVDHVSNPTQDADQESLDAIRAKVV